MKKNLNKISSYIAVAIIGICSLVTIGQIAQARINNGTGSSFSSGVTVGSGSGVWTLSADSNNGNAFVISPSSTLIPNYLTILQTGEVGISSSTPHAKFAVNGLPGGTANLLEIASSTSGFATSTVAVIDFNGNTSFGSSSPSTLFSIQSNHAGSLGGIDLMVGDVNTPSPVVISHKGSTAQGSLTFLGFNAYNNQGGTTGVYNTNSVGYYFQADYRNNTSPAFSFNVLSTTNIASTIFTINSVNQTGFGTTTMSTGLSTIVISSSTAPQLALSTGGGAGNWVFRNAGGNFYIASTSNTALATTTISALTILNGGGIGIASSTPWRALSVTGTVAFDGLTTSTAGNAVCILGTKDIVTAGNTTCITSSKYTKDDIQSMSYEQAKAIIEKMRSVSFSYKDGGTKKYGFIAEEVEKIDPRLVEHAKDDVTLDGHLFKKGDPISVDYAGYTAVLSIYMSGTEVPKTSTPVTNNGFYLLFGALIVWNLILTVKKRK